MLREVVYRRDDGTLVTAIAVYSYRSGPIGRWMIGDTPLDELRDRVVSTKTAIRIVVCRAT